MHSDEKLVFKEKVKKGNLNLTISLLKRSILVLQCHSDLFETKAKGNEKRSFFYENFVSCSISVLLLENSDAKR